LGRVPTFLVHLTLMTLAYSLNKAAEFAVICTSIQCVSTQSTQSLMIVFY